MRPSGVGEALGGGRERQLGWGGLLGQLLLSADRDGRNFGGGNHLWPQVNQPGEMRVLHL